MKKVFVLIGVGGTLLGVYLDRGNLLNAFAMFNVTYVVVDEKRMKLISPLGQTIATIFECEVAD